MVILSIDLGKVCGVSIRTSQGIELEEEYKFKNFYQLQSYVKDLCRQWRPDLVLAPYPTRFYNTILKHGKMLGVICAVCEQLDIVMIEVQDKTCKKAVTGSGKATKDDIRIHYKEPEAFSEHILDARMFADAYLKAVEESAKNL